MRSVGFPSPVPFGNVAERKDSMKRVVGIVFALALVGLWIVLGEDPVERARFVFNPLNAFAVVLTALLGIAVYRIYRAVVYGERKKAGRPRAL